MRRGTPGRAAALRRQRGALLVEALAALLIFSFGLLALAGLQGSLLKAQTQAKGRVDAAALCAELIGAMWADLPRLGDYDTESGCAAASRCGEWKVKVARELPAGTAQVDVTAATGEVTIRIEWRIANADPHRFEARTTVRAAQ